MTDEFEKFAGAHVNIAIDQIRMALAQAIPSEKADTDTGRAVALAALGEVISEVAVAHEMTLSGFIEIIEDQYLAAEKRAKLN